MSREKRDRIELYRTLALLSDYFDKSTRFLFFGILGSILVTIPLSMYFSVFFETPSLITGIMIPFIIGYVGLVFWFYANRFRRQSKRALDNYMGMILEGSLISDPEYERLLTNVRNEIVHSVERITQEPKVSPSREEINRRKKKLNLIRHQIKQAQRRREQLEKQTLLFEKTVAMLERKIYDLTKKAKYVSEKQAEGE